MNREIETLRPGLVGQRIKRFEDPRLLTGSGRFVDDMAPPGLVVLAFRRSDRPHALIRSIDCGDALSVPGVIGVFTASDIENELRPAIPSSRMKGYPLINQSPPPYALEGMSAESPSTSEGLVRCGRSCRG
jgi:CO/xanthine dehydrogenase Mo-binding subunit